MASPWLDSSGQLYPKRNTPARASPPAGAPTTRQLLVSSSPVGERNDWSNGKARAVVDWISGIGGVAVVLVFLFSDGFRKWVDDAWDRCWPWGQIIVAAAVLVALVSLSVAQTLRARRAETKADSTQAGTELAEARAAAAERRTEELEEALAAATADTLDVDRVLATELLAVLPVGSGSVAFARTHSFDCTYLPEDLDGLRELVHVWGGADKSFHDSEVEAARAALLHAGLEMYKHLANYAFHRSDGQGMRIYPDVPLDFELADGSNRDAIAAFHDANSLAEQWVASHDHFVTIARQRLRL